MADIERLTEEDVREIQERIKELAADAQQRTIAAQDAMESLLECEAWDELCGQYPERCSGVVQIDRVQLDCPLSNEGCPYSQRRQDYATSQLLRRIGFGIQSRAPSFDRIPNEGSQGMQEVVGKYVEGLPENVHRGEALLLAGTVGAGKTTALAYVAVRTHRAFPAGQKPLQYYIGAQSLWERLAEEDYNRAREVDVLYIDDLGRENLGGYQGDTADGRFDRLINERWDRGLVTHISTNKSPQTLFADYPRAMSRLQSRGRWALTKASDQRQQ